MYGKKLKDLREENDLKQYFLSELLNLNKRVYGQYEREYVTIPLKHLITLSDYYNVSLDYIFEFTKIKNYPTNNKNYDLNITGNRLKELRKEKGLTQIKIAEFLKIDQPTWSIYEKGKNLIGTPFLYMICKKYNISADYLLGRIDTNALKKDI